MARDTSVAEARTIRGLSLGVHDGRSMVLTTWIKTVMKCKYTNEGHLCWISMRTHKPVSPRADYVYTSISHARLKRVAGF